MSHHRPHKGAAGDSGKLLVGRKIELVVLETDSWS